MSQIEKIVQLLREANFSPDYLPGETKIYVENIPLFGNDFPFILWLEVSAHGDKGVEPPFSGVSIHQEKITPKKIREAGFETEKNALVCAQAAQNALSSALQNAGIIPRSDLHTPALCMQAEFFAYSRDDIVSMLKDPDPQGEVLALSQEFSRLLGENSKIAFNLGQVWPKFDLLGLKEIEKAAVEIYYSIVKEEMG